MSETFAWHNASIAMAAFLALAVVLPTALALPPNFQQAFPKGHPGGRINGDDVRCWDLAQDTELPERCDHFLSPRRHRHRSPLRIVTGL